MPSHIQSIQSELTTFLINEQQADGSWRFCFENGTIIDAYFIILLRSLQIDEEKWIKKLHDRILAQQEENGSWKWYKDEKNGNVTATIDAYYALLYSGYSHKEDKAMKLAERFITENGSLSQSTSILSKAILAATGQIKWPASIKAIPLEIILIPSYLPMNLFQFSGYSRVHLLPMLIMAHRQFSIQTDQTPDLSHLQLSRLLTDDDLITSPIHQQSIEQINHYRSRMIGSSRSLSEISEQKIEQFIIDRIEPDGTLYSYASCTLVMVFALTALGYPSNHPLISNAIRGLMNMSYRTSLDHVTIQNSPSTIWDTALISHALQAAGIDAEHPSITAAGQYLLANQQHRKGDWSVHNPNADPGGWGFSETNTLYPDIDDTTAALRAIHSLSHLTGYSQARTAAELWILSMQNNDGGWPAFEKNVNNKLLANLPLDGAKHAAIDPSIADLTGRSLEYWGNFVGLDIENKSIKKAAYWLLNNQEKNGSWFGRWGICYIYGTWAAITGLSAVQRQDASLHESMLKGVEWLLSIQNDDGGWGESCSSDIAERYIPLGYSTPSQTAWALDALIAFHDEPTTAMIHGMNRLMKLIKENSWQTTYPTGAGLPGHFYVHYHSYRYIWPLITIAHYNQKYLS